MEILRSKDDRGKSITKKSSLNGSRGVPSYKRARVHNNIKSEDLILKRKVMGYIEVTHTQ